MTRGVSGDEEEGGGGVPTLVYFSCFQRIKLLISLQSDASASRARDT